MMLSDLKTYIQISSDPVLFDGRAGGHLRKYEAYCPFCFGRVSADSSDEYVLAKCDEHGTLSEKMIVIREVK